MGGYTSSPTCLGETPHWNELTAREKRVVKASMRELSRNPGDNGQQLFLKFFEEYPDYKNHFGKFRKMEVEQLRNDPILRKHGEIVINTLNYIITHIDEFPKFVATLHSHVHSHIQKGVNIENYNAMFKVFMEVLIANNSDQATQRAWNKVAKLILSEMQEAIITRRGSFTRHNVPTTQVEIQVEL